MRIALALLAIGAAAFATLLLVSALGLIRPNCDGLPLNNRIGRCYIALNAPVATAAPEDVLPHTGVRSTIVPSRGKQ